MRYYDIYSWTILITTVGEKRTSFLVIICHDISVWTLNPPLNIWNQKIHWCSLPHLNSWTKPENQRRCINAKWKEHVFTVLKKLSYFLSSVVKTRTQICVLSPFQITVQTNTTDWKHLSVYYPHKIHVIFTFGWWLLVIVYTVHGSSQIWSLKWSSLGHHFGSYEA